MIHFYTGASVSTEALPELPDLITYLIDGRTSEEVLAKSSLNVAAVLAAHEAHLAGNPSQDFTDRARQLIDGADQIKWKGLLVKVLKCFGEQEGVWYDKLWQEYGILPRDMLAIKAAYYEVYPPKREE